MTKHDAVKAYFEPKIQELTKDVLHFNFFFTPVLAHEKFYL